MIDMEILGLWILVIMTLSIFSYLYGDNPFYKAAEHIFVGISAGYVFTITFWDEIVGNLFGRLWPKDYSDNIFNIFWYFIYDTLGFIFSGFGLNDYSLISTSTSSEFPWKS